ncbi:hypothetical protein [Marivita hallyeonensis]|uniref:Uncharacterized protein n=1 Tax=Marivita hallyeonensis TaxID=996342 RepID=A0A1M5VYL6_9RHOB|nr:hypothetical protein [Marivita hallyeonensis]SHH80345.1 hypothetical protein SAMN05443551_3155 [Marivita hallyeonensis]
MDRRDRPQIDKLLRGIATGHVETVRDAWRDLLQDSDNAVPEVLAKLASPAWTDTSVGPRAQYFGVLLALLDALDPEAFRQESLRLSKTPLHPLHRKTLTLLSKRLTEEPAAHLNERLPVFVASDIDDPHGVVTAVSRWARTRGLDLDGVARVDVMPADPSLDYLGLYNLFFSNIILTWPAQSPRGPRRWWQRFRTEFTFYHEVGHHACGHLEGGTVADQEAEADAYAAKMMRRAHPVLAALAFVLVKPFAIVLKRLLRPSEGTSIREPHPAE